MKRKVKLLSLLVVCAIALSGGLAGIALAETGADLWTVTGTTGEDGTVTLEKTDDAPSQTMTTRANYSNFELEFTIAENLTKKYDGTHPQRQLGFEVRFGDNSALRFAAGVDGNHDNGQWGGGNDSTDGIWLHASPYSVIVGGKELVKVLYVPETGKIKMTVSDGKLSLLYGKESAHLAPPADQDPDGTIWTQEAFRASAPVAISLIDQGDAGGSLTISDVVITDLTPAQFEGDALRMREAYAYKFTEQSWAEFLSFPGVTEAVATVQGTRFIGQNELDAAVGVMLEHFGVLEYAAGYNSFDTQKMGEWTSNGSVAGGALTLSGQNEKVTSRYRYTDFELIFNVTANATGPFDSQPHQAFGFEVKFGEGSAVRFAAGSMSERLGAWYSEKVDGEDVWFMHSEFGVLESFGVYPPSVGAYMPEKGTIKIRVKDGALTVRYLKDGVFVDLPGCEPDLMAKNWTSDRFRKEGNISIGVIDAGGGNGNFSIGDLIVRNLGEGKAPLITDIGGQTDNLSAYEYALSGGDLVISVDASESAGISTGDFLGVTFGGEPLVRETDYTTAQRGGKLSSVRIRNAALRRLFLSDREGAALRVESKYACATVALTFVNDIRHTAVFFGADGAVLERTENIPFGEVLNESRFPALPAGAVGWYVEDKLFDEGGILIDGDKEVHAKNADAQFELTFRYYAGGRSTDIVSRAFEVQYGTQKGQIEEMPYGVEMIAPDTYGYVFERWEGPEEITEKTEINAVYRKLNMNGGDFALDFNGSVNENYVDYIATFMNDGYTSLENDYMQVRYPGKATSMTTKQMYSEFALEFDVVSIENKMINDHLMILSFGNRSANVDEYANRPYQVIIGLSGPDVDGETAGYQPNGTYVQVRYNDGVVPAEKQGLGAFNLAEPLYNTETNADGTLKNVSLRYEPYEIVPWFDYICDTGLSPEHSVSIKIVVREGRLEVYSKRNVAGTAASSYRSEPDGAIDLPSEQLAEGYIAWQPWTDAYIPTEIGLDNFKVTNLAPRGTEIVLQPENKTAEEGWYDYSIGEGDMPMRIDLRYQGIVGVNAEIQRAGETALILPRDVVKEDIVIETVTFSRAAMSDLYAEYAGEYAENGTLSVIFNVLTTKDCFRLPVKIRADQPLSVRVYEDDRLVRTLTGAFGEQFALSEPVPPEGYRFVGWRDDRGDLYDADYALTDNGTLRAEFEIKTYTVKFVDEDGTVYDTQTVGHGASAAAIADPIRRGKKFAGWDKAFDAVTGDLTVTARWKDETDLALALGVGLGVGIPAAGGLAVLAAFLIRKKRKS